MAIYKINKASDYNSSKGAPTEGAVQKYFPYYDIRKFKTFAEFDYKFREPFLAHGSEHKELPNGGGISRRLADELLWCIEINTLEELQNLIAREGRIVMEEDSITIYDDYLE